MSKIKIRIEKGEKIKAVFQEAPLVSFPGRQYRNWVWDEKRRGWVRREK